MTLQFDGVNLQEIRTALLGPKSSNLIEYMYEKQTGGNIGHLPSSTIQTAKDLGWLDHRSEQLTELGRCAADSCREYTFWLQRGRDLPFEGKAEHLSARYFAKKSVLEIGCGMGANLMSLSSVEKNLVGVEPTIAYSQLGMIFREREGMPPIEIRIGRAEALPFVDSQVDLVLCFAAHHYFDICQAFHEIARVLKPGGEVLIIGDTLKAEARLVLSEAWSRPVLVKRLLIDAVNTAAYTASRRRIISASGSSTTSRPIFPLRRTMVRWLREAELIANRPMIQVGPDTCFSAKKAR